MQVKLHFLARIVSYHSETEKCLLHNTGILSACSTSASQFGYFFFVRAILRIGPYWPYSMAVHAKKAQQSKALNLKGPIMYRLTRLGQIGLDWVRLGQIGLDWARWAKLGQIGSDRARLDQIGLDWARLARLGYIGLDQARLDLIGLDGPDWVILGQIGLD